MILVQNIRGTSTNRCGCGNWLRHWHQHGGFFTLGCSTVNCSGSAEVGAHVKKVIRQDRNWYIISLCKSCNGKNLNFKVGYLTTFLSANVAKTCGKPSHFFSW